MTTTDQTLPVDDELIVSYDHPNDVTDQIDELRDSSDWAALHELATDLAHDLELVQTRLVTAYERLDALTEGASR